MAVGTSEGTVLLVDLERAEECQLPGQHKRGVGSVMFSPNSSHLVSRAGAELKLWDLASMRLQANFEVYHAAAFSPEEIRRVVAPHQPKRQSPPIPRGLRRNTRPRTTYCVLGSVATMTR